MAQPRSNSISDPTVAPSRATRTLQLALGLAAAGAVVLLLPLLGTVAGLIGLIAIIAGTVFAAPYADLPGSSVAGWWTILAAGAVIALVGEPLTLAVKTLGGLFTALGGILVAVAVALGFPLRSQS